MGRSHMAMQWKSWLFVPKVAKRHRKRLWSWIKVSLAAKSWSGARTTDRDLCCLQNEAGPLILSYVLQNPNTFYKQSSLHHCIIQPAVILKVQPVVPVFYGENRFVRKMVNRHLGRGNSILHSFKGNGLRSRKEGRYTLSRVGFGGRWGNLYYKANTSFLVSFTLNPNVETSWGGTFVE